MPLTQGQQARLTAGRSAGHPIVGTTWLEASGQAGVFVDPLDHLLRDDAAEKRMGFNLATSYQRAQHRLLLAGKDVLLSPSIFPCPVSPCTPMYQSWLTHNLTSAQNGPFRFRMKDFISTLGLLSKLSHDSLLAPAHSPMTLVHHRTCLKQIDDCRPHFS